MTTDRWSAIERIFHEALERPSEARAAFLTESCGGNEQLRREVQSLLDNATLSQFLEQPALQVAAGMATGPGVASLIGQRIGVYQIQLLLGKGGMGEVYRARDTKLNRDVALKVLPASVAGDQERLARFRREARVLAALNHPNIANIHGLEDTSSAPALVMELVDGPTLADRLATNRGLALSDTLAIARQIANALEAAHAHQIIHRDLKPANIKVRDDGTVKVLDFGLAKVLASTGSGDVETLTALDTQAGLVMGTPAYMSPEQARGAAVDERTDIWAFGCVLYELLSGRRTFVGDSAVQILNAVIEREPDWTAISHVPPAIQKLVRRCLQKDSRRRLRDIGDARLELEDAETVGDTPHAGGAGKPRRPWLWMSAGLSAGLIVAAAAAAFAYWRWQPASSEPWNVRFETVTDAVGLEESPAISPDGKMVAFTAFSGGRRQLFVRVLAGGVSSPVTNDDLDHEDPRWAPDSTTILYLGRSASGDRSTLYEIPFTGGQPRHIAPALTGGDISPLDGQKIAVFQAAGAGVKLVVIRRDGTPVSDVARRTPGRMGERTPRWAPDGRSIAYIDTGMGVDDAINIVSAAGGEPRKVYDKDIVRGLSWLPDASGLVFGSGLGSTMTYPPTFQLRVIRLNGAASEQLTYGVDSLTDPDVHETGLVLVTRTVMNSAIWQIAATGTPAVNHKNTRIVTHLTSQVQTPSASPEGSQLVYLSDSGGHGNLWVIGTDGVGRRQLTREPDPSVKIGVPVWSPNGSTIAYPRFAGGKSELWLVNKDGTSPRPLQEGVSASWSPNGEWLYYTVTGTDARCIRKIRLADNVVEPIRCGDAGRPLLRKDGTLFFVKQFVATSGGFDYEFHKANPESRPDTTFLRRIDARQIAYDSRLGPPSALSPDGRWVALALMNRATTNLWRMSTESGDLHQVTDFGDRATWIVRQVTWSDDSKFIYAAIADLDADIVSIAGAVSGKAK